MNGVVRRLAIRVMGPPEMLLADSPLFLGTAKARALLFYLAVNRQPHSRDHLVALLWAEMPESNARRNLTATLSTLRKDLADFILVDRDQIALNPDSLVQVDLFRLHYLIAQARETDDVSPLHEAASLYRGPFLHGFTVKNAGAFEEWQLREASRLHESMMHLLTQLVTQAITNDDNAHGIEYALRLLEIEPWYEQAHRQLMRLYAQSGRTETALAQFEACRELLETELGQLPGDETLQLYEQLKAGHTQLPHNLPPQNNTFVGRQPELAHVVAKLQAGDCRLLTVIGAGGMGKTRLAIESARQLLDSSAPIAEPHFKDGIYLIELATLEPGQNSAEQLASMVGDILDISFHQAASLEDQLRSFLRGKSMLLIFDNFEQLLARDAHPPELKFLESLLTDTNAIKLLVTSRERLNIQAEWVLLLDGLDYPAKASSIEELRGYAAIDLFARRGQQASHNFQLTEADIEPIISLCQSLEGLPLGIELAATWSRFLSPADIVAELQSGLDAIERTARNMPARHRNLFAVIDYSWRLLSPNEQTILRRLAVFRGGFDRFAARKTVGASLSQLVRLADKSLLRYSEAGRYSMHNLLAQFTREELAKNQAESWDSHLKYAIYYADLARQSHHLYFSGDYPRSIEQLRLEIVNIRAACQWLLTQIRAGRYLDELIPILDQYCEPLNYYFQQHTLQTEGIEFFSQAKRVLEQAEVPAALRQLNTITLARYKVRLAELHYFRGDYAEIPALLESSIPIFKAEGLLDDEGLAVDVLALINRRRGEYARTKELGLRCQRLYEKSGNPVGYIRAISHIALVAADEGDYPLAVKTGRQIVERYRQLNDLPRLTRWLANLGNTNIRAGNYLQAKPLLEEAIVHARGSNNRFSLVITLTNLGHVHSELGQFREAEAYLNESLQLSRELGNRRWIAINLDGLAANASLQRRWLDVETFARQALPFTVEIKSDADTMGIISRLAHAWAHLGSPEEALRILSFVAEHPASLRFDKEKNAALLEALRRKYEEPEPAANLAALIYWIQQQE